MLAHTHTCTHTNPKAAVTQLLPLSEPAVPGTTQVLEPCVANPPGAGLVISRRAVQVSRIEIVEPKVPQQLHTAKRDKGSWTFASLVYIRVDVGCFPSWHQATRSCLVDWSNVSKVSCSRKQQQHQSGLDRNRT